MLWLIVALIGHTANGVAFIIDKILLKNAFKQSATYAGLVGLLSFSALILFPWVDVWPHGMTLVWTIVSGVTFTLALWMFFSALSRGEASRVVPVISALIPMMTLAGTSLFLHERLNGSQLLGFFLLIAATVILSSGKAKQRLTREALMYSLIAALLFAVMSVTMKAIYDDVGFISGFFNTRMIAALTAVALVTMIDPIAGKEIKSIFTTKKTKKPQKGDAQIAPKTAGLLALLGQTLGGLGFVGVQYAISLGSAAIVNALQVAQFALLVLAAFMLKSRAETLLGETLSRRTVLIKALALVIMAAGLALIV